MISRAILIFVIFFFIIAIDYLWCFWRNTEPTIVVIYRQLGKVLFFIIFFTLFLIAVFERWPIILLDILMMCLVGTVYGKNAKADDSLLTWLLLFAVFVLFSIVMRVDRILRRMEFF